MSARSYRPSRRDDARRCMRPPPLLQIQHCVSLGPTCNAAEYLRCHPAGLRRYALPFDWIHSDAALVRGMPQTARTPNEPDLARDHSQHSTALQRIQAGLLLTRLSLALDSVRR